MEGRPYCLHLCLSERDFLPGASIYDITAEAIERCLKFVVILSRNFEDSDGARYESQIAMSLSQGLLVNALYIISQMIVAFWLALSYDLLVDQLTDEVIYMLQCSSDISEPKYTRNLRQPNTCIRVLIYAHMRILIRTYAYTVYMRMLD